MATNYKKKKKNKTPSRREQRQIRIKQIIAIYRSPDHPVHGDREFCSRILSNHALKKSIFKLDAVQIPGVQYDYNRIVTIRAPYPRMGRLSNSKITSRTAKAKPV
jgi:hypothetical protein